MVACEAVTRGAGEHRLAVPTLYLCRHGQTDWNAEGRLQGQQDIDLNALGHAQAKRNGRYLRNVLGANAENYDFVSSPLTRTMETMRIIRAEIGLDPEAFRTDERLLEINFGDWEGMTLDEIGARDPEGAQRRRKDKWNYLPPGARAESYVLMARRVAPVFEALQRPTVIVAHGGVTRCFLHLYAGYDDKTAAKASIAQDRILRYPGFEDRPFEWV